MKYHFHQKDSCLSCLLTTQHLEWRRRKNQLYFMRITWQFAQRNIYIYIYTLLCKVIGISKKTQFERMFLFSLQFFLHRICRLMTSASSKELSAFNILNGHPSALKNCWIILGMLSCSLCKTFAEILFHGFWRTSHNSSCNFGCFFYLLSI